MTHRPEALLHAPCQQLSDCIFGGVERDTRGRSLSDAERFNYYPASPMAAISWTFSGTFHMVEERGPTVCPTLGPPLPRLLFCGPQSRPSASWATGPTHALIVGFFPEALGRLLGVEVERYLDKVLPLDSVASKEVMEACEAVFSESDAIAPFLRIEKQIVRLWECRDDRTSWPTMNSWIRSLAMRVALSTPGRGLRQFQRRIKRWTGQSHRDLQLYARVEDAFVRRNEHRKGDTLDLASLAQGAGYADQSHLGREIRRVTGLSPARLEELIASDEGFWYYRLVDGWINDQRSQKNIIK